KCSSDRLLFPRFLSVAPFFCPLSRAVTFFILPTGCEVSRPAAFFCEKCPPKKKAAEGCRVGHPAPVAAFFGIALSAARISGLKTRPAPPVFRPIRAPPPVPPRRVRWRRPPGRKPCRRKRCGH